MKTLKRTLGLVLALVLLVSMFTVAAGATYTDDADIQYSDEVAILDGIGVIDGYPDGTFDPTGTVSRAEAAKMIAYSVLGDDLAETLVCDEAPFTDVAVTAWEAPYVEWCSTEGIIAGYGNGAYGPDDNVTTIQLWKMILTTLGYGAKGEYDYNPDWVTNVQDDAARYLGLVAAEGDDDILDAATREECAFYIFWGFANIPTVHYLEVVDLYVPVIHAIQQDPIFIFVVDGVDGVVVENGDTCTGCAAAECTYLADEADPIAVVTAKEDIGAYCEFVWVNGEFAAYFNRAVVTAYESTGTAADLAEDAEVGYEFLNYVLDEDYD